MSTLLFVYGTLKQGCRNHRRLAGQTLVGAARTVAGFQLRDLGGYPGLAAHPADQEGVRGEVWSVDAPCLRALDRFEGVSEGLYRREPVALQEPFAGQAIDAYFPAGDVSGRPVVGPEWVEPPGRP
jgi:gamma-glutamylcyclotransferase (GGCT)/AIG2-like uncharacterized protein YtfP